MSAPITITLDGKLITVDSGQSIIRVADQTGVAIPRFCYHKKLSVAANCRMCLVEVKNAPKLVAACSTMVAQGMEVFTQSIKTKAAQQSVMEFLLINHPLDCPICDQGGACELQDLALIYGSDRSRFSEPKRVVIDKDIGPLITTDMTRCIHCTRCVRFGQEVAGQRELGATGRGEHMEIGTYLERSVDSELSGNIIDLCPVGALTSKPFRFKARAWELRSRESIAAHDCLGSHIFVHTLKNKILRVVPRVCETLNENWLSDRDRFSYEGLYQDRIETPKLKQNGEWIDVSWAVALDAVAGILRSTPSLGALLSPSSTLEEGYLFQKFFRSLGFHNIDHRIHTGDFRDQDDLPMCPTLGRSVQSLEDCDYIYIIGGFIRHEQPLLNHRIRKAALKGAQVIVLSDYKMDWNFSVRKEILINQGDYCTHLYDLIAHAELSKNGAILLGSHVLSHPNLSTIRSLAYQLSDVTQATLGELPPGANYTGVSMAGVLPHRGPLGVPLNVKGLNALEIINARLNTYFLMNIEPEYDCLDPMDTIDALTAAKDVIVLSPYQTPKMLAYATLILPMKTFYEMAGTLVNIEGQWQSVEAATTSPIPAGWQVLHDLAHRFERKDFTYHTTQDIISEIQALTPVVPKKYQYCGSDTVPSKGLIRLAPKVVLMDNITRRAQSLQKTKIATQAFAVRIHPNTAKQYDLIIDKPVLLTQKGKIAQEVFDWVLDPHIPEGAVFLASGLESTCDLGAPYTDIQVSQL